MFKREMKGISQEREMKGISQGAAARQRHGRREKCFGCPGEKLRWFRNSESLNFQRRTLNGEQKMKTKKTEGEKNEFANNTFDTDR